MTNIFSIVRKNAFTKKFLSWFLALSIFVQGSALPLVASAEDDANNVSVPQPITIIASKIVCDDEAKLPNWGLGGPDVTSTTAADYAAAHSGCVLTPGWKFQWGFGPKSGDFGVNDFPGDFIGEANGASALGLATGVGYNEWKTFGPTTPNGVAVTQITDLDGASEILVREVLQDEYVPFTFDDVNQSNANDVSAEMYCSTDVLNYDNLDFIGQPELGKTYYCVAFNAKKKDTHPPIQHPQCSDGLDNDQDGTIDFAGGDAGCDVSTDDDENNKPVITVITPNPTIILLGSIFVDLGANATDTEDCIGLTQSACNSALTLTANGPVNTAVLGTSTITYTAVDSQGQSADQKTRTVVVMATPAQCSDGLDNDQDGKIDFPLDLGCDSVTDNDENNKPVITVVTPNPTIILLGSIFVDLGANATDTEDCIGLTQSACNTALHLTATGTVNTSVLGTSTITYTAVDSQGQTADPKTRTVVVEAVPLSTACKAPTDTLLLIDRSGSMTFDGTNPAQPLTHAKGAADTFIDKLSTSTDYVGIVSYNLAATLNQTLTNNFSSAKSSYASLTATGGTDIGLAIERATTEFSQHGRVGTKHIVILLSDGIPDVPGKTPAQSSAEAVQKANVAKAAGAVIYTIGLGNGVNPTLMTQIASLPANYYFAPSGTVLETIYRNISDIECQRNPALISGKKINDANGNGVVDNGETGIADWQITLTSVGGTLLTPRTEETNSSGEYVFDDVLPGTYNLCEVNKSGWAQTYPATSTNNGCYPVTILEGDHLTGKNFLNKESLKPQCSDGIDNDQDGKIDFAGGDLGCDSVTDNDENNKPVITVIAPNPTIILLGSVFVDLGANATDTEDCISLTQSACNTLLQLTPTGTVNTSVLGTSTITYNATDTQGIAADPKTRTVVVQVAPPQCSDGIDNDQDGKIDFAGGDLGCDTPTDNNENDKPVISVITPNPTIILLGSIFVDLGANATDTEDCISLTQSACNTALHLTATGTVNTSVLGTTTITYTAVDSQGLTALPKTRTVVVQVAPPQCSDGLDNDQDGEIDFVGGDAGCDTPTDNSENGAPVITLIGSASINVFINTTFTELGANATDTEDCVTLNQTACNTALHLNATGTVNTSVLGVYTITYNATDSQNLAAVPVSRTVHVLPNTPVCTVNCGGGSDNSRPVITLIGSNPLDVVVGTTFTDPGATASDPEDGNLTPNIVVTGGPVTTATVGNFTLSYDVSDSKGLAAQQVRRDVHVVPAPITGCVTNCGGGGGGGPIGLSIFNERIVTTGTTTVTITWNTNQLTDSRVVYGLDHVASLGNAPQYGYPLTTATDSTLTTNHSMVISGIPSAIATYFRPLSADGARKVVGIELTRAPVVSTPQECFYLREYMRLGANNNPAEVIKLQTFLHNNEGFTALPVTGFFDIATDQAVRTFQDRYKKDVLDFWNLPGNTGYVYFTTQKKVNELYCKREFPLDRTQMDEIIAFRALIQRVNAINAQGGVAPTVPLVGINLPGDRNGNVAGASTVEGGEIGSGAATVIVATPPGVQSDDHRFRLGDLLAISPNLGGLSGTETASKTPNLEVAAVGVLPEKKGFSFGSFFSSIVSRIVGICK